MSIDSGWSPQEKIELLLKAMTPDQLELAVGFIIYEHGWWVELTPASGDGGFDLRAWVRNRDRLVEVKSGTQSVDPRMIREGVGACIQQGVPEAAFVSIGGFTASATDAAVQVQQHPAIRAVELIDCQNLVGAAMEIPDVVQTLECIYRDQANTDVLLYDQMTLEEYWTLDSLYEQRQRRRSTQASYLADSTAMFAA